MLKGALVSCLVVAAVHAEIARAESPHDRMRMPERLTAGAADQFLGALSPDGRRLYFVSAQSSTLQIFSQDLTGGPALPLFDEGADCTTPRPSPDGKWLAYLSYRADATGDVCVRDLATLARRCLTDADSSESDVLWTSPDELLTVTRRGVRDDLEVDRLARDGRKRQSLMVRDLASPAVSPDGRWLAYIPTERGSDPVGASFSSRAVRAIALQRFDRLQDKPSQISFDLPGASGFPAFSSDSRFMYFAQYLDDTNLDGVIDAHDRSTLFRVPFDPSAATPIAARDRAHPEQLTSVTWNCQYPSPGPPASDRLIATCSLSGTLDVYELPANGAVPPEWTADKLHEELLAATDRGERLLLLDRLLALQPAPAEARVLLEEVLRLHLDRGALESAAWTLTKLQPIHPEIAPLLGELIAHRRSERALDRGLLSAGFLADARTRLQRVTALSLDEDGGVLRAIVRAELLDVLGDKIAATEALAAAPVAVAKSNLVLHLLAARAADLYTALDRRASLLGLEGILAAHPAFDERTRLTYADRYIATLLRGAPRSTRGALIDEALPRASEGGELRTRLQLERLLIELTATIDDPSIEKLRASTFELYRKTDSLERRRSIVHVIVTRAGALDSDKIVYDFANAWVSLLPRGTAERRYAEKLYRDVLLERAYVDLRTKHLPDARGRFYGITLQTDSLEAWTGFLELRAREDAKRAESELVQRYAKTPNHPVLRYGRAYLVARTIATLPLPQRLVALDEAIAHIKIAAEGLSRSRELNFLWARLLYARYLTTGDRAFAQEAHTKLLLTLDLSSDNPRYRAIALELAGKVQAMVGNQRIALEHFVERDRLPFAENDAELSHLVTEARAQQLLDNDKEASSLAEKALALTTRPALAVYRTLVLDRAALHHLAAGEAELAIKRYDELMQALPGAMLTPAELARASFTARLGRGSARLLGGRLQEALADLSGAQSMLEKNPAVATPPSRTKLSAPPDHDAVRGYRTMLHGLSAEAHRRLNELPAAIGEQTLRRNLLRARYKDAAADEDLLAIGDAEMHLGEYEAKRGRLEDAVSHYRAALAAGDTFSEKSGTEVHPLRLHALADLTALRMRDATSRGDAELEVRLATLLLLLSKQPNPAWAQDRAQLERDLTSLTLKRNDAH